MTKAKQSLRPSSPSFKPVRRFKVELIIFNSQSLVCIILVSICFPFFFSVCRGYLAKKKYKELVEEKNKAATKIQARYRGHKQRKSFKRKRYESQKILKR